MERVLVIDDDRLIRNIVKRYLSSSYEVETAEDGKAGLEAMPVFSPDVVLLDIEMPGINGFEVCDRIKQNPQFSDTPILIISGRTQLQERMQGYEAGASDFIQKPFEPEELLAKLKVLSQYYQHKHQLSAQVEVASKTAFTAMRGSSELGLAIQFIESSYGAKSYDDIARKFFEVTHHLSLNCILMFRTEQETYYFSSTGVISPLEKEVIRTIYQSGRRFCDFGMRTQINYPRVALLVKNMPLNDQEAYGRYKDFLPTMLGSTDASIKSLETEQALARQTQGLAEAFHMVKDTLGDVGNNLQMTQRKVVELLRNTITELDNRIPLLGLDDDQEQYLINTLDGAIHGSHTIIESGEQASAAFERLCAYLDEFTGQQTHVAQQPTCVEAADAGAQYAGGADEGSVTGDVELF